MLCYVIASCQGNFASGVQKLAPSVAFANVDSRTGLHSLGTQKSRPWRRLASVFEKRPIKESILEKRLHQGDGAAPMLLLLTIVVVVPLHLAAHNAFNTSPTILVCHD